MCLPFVPESPQQLQLDAEVNTIIENNWNDWMNGISAIFQRSLHDLDNSIDVSVNLTDYLIIDRPHNLVSALLVRCSE